MELHISVTPFNKRWKFIKKTVNPYISYPSFYIVWILCTVKMQSQFRSVIIR